MKPYSLEVAEGNAGDAVEVLINGISRNVDLGIETDIWDRANATDDQDIIVAPTAARVHAIVSDDANDSCGTGTLTLTGQPLDTETVTIGTKVYTFQTALTDVDGNVLIGADAEESLDNLVAAVNLAAGAGTTYAASMTAPSENVVAVDGAGTTLEVYDIDSAGIATTETLTNGSWGGATVTPGTGARTVRVHGLTSWTAERTTEDVTLQGTVAVNTTNSFVFIDFIEVLTWGGSGPNVGTITATAATDSTVSAQIQPGYGETKMAVRAVPSGKTLHIQRIYGNIINAGAGSEVEVKLLVNDYADTILTGFKHKHNFSLRAAGNTNTQIPYVYPKKVAGPAIVKMQVVGDSNNMTVTAGFDAVEKS